MGQDLGKLVKETRRLVGLSQIDLVRGSGVCLASIQNLESGKTSNPSLDTISAVLTVIGFRLVPSVLAVDWDLLALCGLPLLSHNASHLKPTPELLVKALRIACLELVSKADVADIEDRARKETALRALVWALSSHYPKFFSKYFAKSPLITHFLPSGPRGPLIKLRRQALAVLGTYI